MLRTISGRKGERINSVTASFTEDILVTLPNYERQRLQVVTNLPVPSVALVPTQLTDKMTPS
jgi:hypothetical protein